jgi:hypothetical protein
MSSLQFTDRSRFLLRTGKCPRAAFLSTAWGPTGYGIARKRVSTPLASGTMLHDGLGYILDYLLNRDMLPTDAITTQAVALAHAKYDATVAARGLSFWGENDVAMIKHIQEQRALIEALIWVWVLEKLPALHAEYRVVAVESEEVSVYACTCSILDGIPPWEDHEAKGCEGIALQSKADWIGQHRDQPDAYTYHEFKSSGLDPGIWADKWDTDIQPHLGPLGWQDRTGLTITGCFVHGLFKGRRAKERMPEDRGRKYTGPDYQDSRLVYGYCKPGTPPLVPDDWAAEYEWWDEQEHRARRLGPSYKKRLTSEYPGGVRQWVLDMAPEERQKHVMTVGPILPNPERQESAVEAWVQSEVETREKIWQLHEIMAEPDVAGDWTHRKVQGELDRSFPQSWNCRPYGRRHECDFVKICLKQAGWQDPEGALDYIPRRPHHDPELQQAIARGLLVPEDQGEEDEND